MVLSAGHSSPVFVEKFAGAHATTVVSDSKPVFIFVNSNLSAPATGMQIVRMKQRGTEREARIMVHNPYGDEKRLEIAPGDRILLRVEDGDTTRTVTPIVDLTPGEYVLFEGVGGGGYDFAVALPADKSGTAVTPTQPDQTSSASTAVMSSKSSPNSGGQLQLSPSPDATASPQLSRLAAEISREIENRSEFGLAVQADIAESESMRFAGDELPKPPISNCLIVSKPDGAEIDIDGKKVGQTPLFFKLGSRDGVSRIVTIKKEGYVTVERRYVPDGQDIRITETLERQQRGARVWPPQ